MLKRFFILISCYLSFFSLAVAANAIAIKSHIAIKQPGNPAVTYSTGTAQLPVEVTEQITPQDSYHLLTVTIHANQRVYFNYGAVLETGLDTDGSDFYLPGFWYHKNLRSPKEAPSFHSSKSWNFREDRLSAPLTGVWNSLTGKTVIVARVLDTPAESLTTAMEGEVIVSGNTSIGYAGFDNETGRVGLTFGYPYVETPTRYIRKLTLAPSVQAFAQIEAGETKTLRWLIHEARAADYGDFVRQTWEFSFDTYHPQPLTPMYSPEEMKKAMTRFFRQSYVTDYPLKFNSGHTLLTDDCLPYPAIQIGFVGRVLLNAFNEVEYGEQHGEQDLQDIGYAIFDSFLEGGFSDSGYLHDNIDYRHGGKPDGIHSIRQQSEGAYALLHFLRYEKAHGRKHPGWEKRVRTMLDNFLRLQKADGSFARKFRDDGSDVDGSGGSTPSATVPLVMAYKYFGDKRYLNAAKRTVEYLETNIISKSDYFSSTLDANCEDKEAAISAATATYYMALVTKGHEQKHYISLCQQASYFALTWYYLWDVPFAQGQMLGDLGLKTRGWGNVSVENNHIDVFVFELPTILHWLSQNTANTRFAQMYDVIFTSLSQLLPTEQRHCGIAESGYYPEVVQHTTWDYGRNGKGFYNNYFAPGWTVASLWEMYTPKRTKEFFGY